MPSLSLQYIVVEWLIPLAMVPLVARKRRPFPAIAWLGFIFAVPYVGVPLYLLAGEFGLRRRRRRHAVDAGELAGAVDIGQLPERQRPFAQAVHGLARDRGAPAPILTARAVELLEDVAAVDRLIGDIQAARDHVHLLFFIYADDQTGWRVAHALADAAARGVECRLLMDAHGSRKALRSIAPWLQQRGVSVDRSLKISLLEKGLRRVDVRNHRKIAVIDGTVGYTGSMNVHDPQFELDDGAWHQITARVEGDATRRLQQVFATDWRLSTDELLRGTRYYPAADAHGEDGEHVHVRVLEDGPSYACDSIQPMLVELIHSARERLVLTTPYFVPDEPVLLAVRLAALRGVDVQLFVPLESDRRLADAAARALFDELLRAGVCIHRHGDGVLHAKTVTVDDEIAVVGTANVDYRSFFLNFEVLLIIHDERKAAELRRMQEAYGAACERVEADGWGSRSRWEKYRDDVAKLFSPLL